MKYHESTHSQPIPHYDSQGLLFSTDISSTETVSEKDDMFNYQCSLLEYGMLILNFLDAVKEGDGNSLLKK